MPTLADVERIREAMQSLPEVKAEERVLKNQEAVSQLSADIEAMRSKGYTWEQVADFFSQNGIEIKATTLKSYARRATTSTTKARKPRQKKATPTVTPAPSDIPPVQQVKATGNKGKPTETQASSTAADATFTVRKDTRDI